MTWRLIHQAGDGVHAPRHWASAAPCPSLLHQGSVLLECDLPAGVPVLTLLDVATGKGPLAASLTITTDGQGGLSLRQSLGGRVRTLHMPGVFRHAAAEVSLIFRWDCEAREAVLHLSDVTHARDSMATFPAPLPLPSRLAAAMAQPGTAEAEPALRLFAFCDHPLPIGPLPSLTGDTLMPRVGGLCEMSDLRLGDELYLPNGERTQIRWVGRMFRPAWGRNAPVRLRAPYYGAIRDLVCAPDQRLTLRSCEVEYLFATDEVAALVGDLTEGLAPEPVSGAPLVEYWQVVTDRCETLRIGGLSLETLDCGPILQDPALHRLSILSNLPKELLPLPGSSAPPVLRKFETWTLCQLRAA